MHLVIFGANGPAGLELCQQALAEGHTVTAAVRRPGEFPIKNAALSVVESHVTDGSPLGPVIGNAEAVLSTLGTAYSRKEISLYSRGTKAIVEGMRSTGHCRRLVVVSAGLVVPGPKVRGFIADSIMLPLLRNVVGRTLYEDMARMENYLATCGDIAWTIMRPGRLTNGSGVTKYRLDNEFPTGNITTRSDLAAAMLAELGPAGHVHQRIAPTTR